jgi:mycoredoxin
MTEESSKIKFYATQWCGDCRRAFFLFKRNNIDLVYIDIDEDPEGEKFVKSVNNGNRSVPTIVFPDGSLLVEPNNQEILDKLNLPV